MASKKSLASNIPAPRKFDLATRRVAETFDVSIVDPEDSTTPTGITITLAARHSPHATAAALSLAAAQRALGDAAPPEQTDWRVAVTPLLAACTLSWENVEDAGARPDCTSENAERLYRLYPWLNDQVGMAFLGKTAFFDATRAA